MSGTVSIKKNFIMNAILTMSSFIFPLISFPYVSRILLPVGTGKVSFAISLVSYFAIFAQLGIPTYGVRACAQVRDDRTKLTRTVQELLFINLVMCVIVYAAFFAAIAFVPRLQGERLLYVIVSMTMLLNAIGIEWLYRGLERYTYITIRSIIFKLIALALMFLLIHKQEDYVIYGFVSVFAASASGIMNFLYARKHIDLFPVQKLNPRRHLKAIGVFFAMSCATTIYTNLDVVMLGFMTTDADVGYYNAAVKIKLVLISIVTSMGAVLLPRSSYYVEKGETESFHRITEKALSFVFLCAVPLMTYFIVFATEGISFLSGPNYTPAVPAMQLIMPTLLFVGITNILGIQVLVPLGREKAVLHSEIAGAVTDLILNALLIPKYKSAGAAIGTLAAEFVVLIVQYTALRKEDIGKQFKRIRYADLCIADGIAVMCVIWIKRLQIVSSGTWNSFIILVVSAVVFFGVFTGYLVIRKNAMMLEIIRSVRNLVKRGKQ